VAAELDPNTSKEDTMSENNKTTFGLAEAKELLARSYRYESRDSAFGDSEVTWYERPFSEDDDQNPVADGYFSRDIRSVGVTAPNGETVEFTGRDASALFFVGNGRGSVGENSSIPRSHPTI
jgi:hypothetical protein